jgi:hypothetical protein
MTTKEFNERKRFLDVYSEFDKWLKSIGFRAGHYWTESATPLDCSYSHYKDHIDSLYGVEHNIHDVLKLSIRFLRDRHEHKFMFVWEMGSYSETTNIEQTKELILIEVRKLRDEQLAKLSALVSF